MEPQARHDALSAHMLTPESLSKLIGEYQRQDQFLHVQDAVSKDLLGLFQNEADRLRPLLHRNYIPLRKQGGSISYRLLRDQQCPILDFYRSPEMLAFLERITGKRLLVCPESDSHACALYYYTQEGDFIQWHYDSSFYKGERFTVLLSLRDTTSSDSCLLTYQLYTRLKDQPVEECAQKLEPGSFTIFNGDRLWHKVTPRTSDPGERIVLSLEYVTSQEIGLVGKCISDVKDAVTYFGISSLLPWSSSTKLLPGVDRRAIENGQVVEPAKAKVICFVNPVSGAQRGCDLIPLLREVLGADNVYDLSVTGPLPGLIANIHERNLRVIACGGDGTVRWVIQTMIDYNFLPLPPIGVLPMGTGNDLSREFGWGISYTPKRHEIASIVERLQRATSRQLDIWQVNITPWDPQSGQRDQTRTTSEVMFNYYNMGFNAQAAYGFHSMRRQSPELFKSRFINKCWYFYYGLGTFQAMPTIALSHAGSLVTGGMNLSDVMEVKVDGEKVILPSALRTLVLLNFTCYQAGLDIWGPPQPGDTRKPKMDDKLLEVVGLGGPTHEALVRLYITSGKRVAQGGHVEIAIQKPGVSVAMAYDGEPFWQEPCVVDVKLWGQVDILRNPELVSN